MRCDARQRPSEQRPQSAWPRRRGQGSWSRGSAPERRAGKGVGRGPLEPCAAQAAMRKTLRLQKVGGMAGVEWRSAWAAGAQRRQRPPPTWLSLALAPTTLLLSIFLLSQLTRASKNVVHAAMNVGGRQGAWVSNGSSVMGPAGASGGCHNATAVQVGRCGLPTTPLFM